MTKEYRPFIRGKVVINSMRDNGYKNAAYALAELIDNSIQAKATLVELITFSEYIKHERRSTDTVDQIAIFDNGLGMTPEVLHAALEFGASENRNDVGGIGKFGMGLPNASISKCRHVDVWSWQNGNDPAYTYLDIQEIIDGDLEQIPAPVKAEIPLHLKNAIGGRLPKGGTIVLWSDLDRLNWKTPKSIYRHVQDVIGRMYRHYIDQGKVVVKYKSIQKREGNYVPVTEEIFLANDPLYLMKNTSLDELPGDFAGEAFFEPVEDFIHEMEDEFGEKHDVRIRTSVVKESILNAIKALNIGTPGKTKWGVHTGKNMGLSVVRADRELDLKPEFLTTKLLQGTGRFVGLEITFPPKLDNIFGVLNNKQDAVNLRLIDRDEDAKREGYEQVSDYITDLKAENDPKVQIYELINAIDKVRLNVGKKIADLNVGGEITDITDEGSSAIADLVSALATNKGKDRTTKGHSSDSDDTELTQEGVVEVYEEAGYTKEEAEEKARFALLQNLKYKIEEEKLTTAAFFDVASKNGFTLVQINKSHPFYEKILSTVDSEQQGMLELAIAAWARMEDECSGESSKNRMRVARQEWGAMLADFLED